MSKSSVAPYSWDQIEDQVRLAILCQYSILWCLGPSGDAVALAYLCVDASVMDHLDMAAPGEEHLAAAQKIDLSRHHLHVLARMAYSYAYQLDGCDAMSETEVHEIICAVLSGFPQSDMHGNPSPLSSENDEPLRRVFDTAIARWKLYDETYGSSGLTMRELALLSGMTVPAARTSLSKEGFKLEASARHDGARREDDRAATLNVDDALVWLSRRRGFVPNRDAVVRPADERIEEAFADDSLTFDQALHRALLILELDAGALSEKIGLRKDWLDGLTSGGTVTIDVPELRKLARVIGIDESNFVANAVRHLIRRDIEASRPMT